MERENSHLSLAESWIFFSLPYQGLNFQTHLDINYLNFTTRAIEKR